jgi:hypothetical protein
MMEPQDFPGGAGRAIEIFLGQQFGGIFHQARFAPAAVGLGPVSEQGEAKAEAEEK